MNWLPAQRRGGVEAEHPPPIHAFTVSHGGLCRSTVLRRVLQRGAGAGRGCEIRAGTVLAQRVVVVGAEYVPRVGNETVLHAVVRGHLESLRAEVAASGEGHTLPPFVEREFREFLSCGVLARGFAVTE